MVKGFAGMPSMLVKPKISVRIPMTASFQPVRAVAVPGAPELKIILMTMAATAAIRRMTRAFLMTSPSILPTARDPKKLPMARVTMNTRSVTVSTGGAFLR